MITHCRYQSTLRKFRTISTNLGNISRNHTTMWSLTTLAVLFEMILKSTFQLQPHWNSVIWYQAALQHDNTDGDCEGSQASRHHQVHPIFYSPGDGARVTSNKMHGSHHTRHLPDQWYSWPWTLSDKFQVRGWWSFPAEGEKILLPRCTRPGIQGRLAHIALSQCLNWHDF